MLRDKFRMELAESTSVVHTLILRLLIFKYFIIKLLQSMGVEVSSLEPCFDVDGISENSQKSNSQKKLTIGCRHIFRLVYYRVPTRVVMSSLGTCHACSK